MNVWTTLKTQYTWYSTDFLRRWGKPDTKVDRHANGKMAKMAKIGLGVHMCVPETGDLKCIKA